MEAIKKEIRGLLEVEVWKEIPRSEVRKGAKVIPGKIILDIKTMDGKFVKCKARYVSRGDLTKEGEHYFESSSHQIKAKSLRIFYATAVNNYATTKKKSYIPRNLDISQAYLQSIRQPHEPDVYMELPEETFGLCKDKHVFILLWKKFCPLNKNSCGQLLIKKCSFLNSYF
jgi:hypothetical protein